MYLVHGNGVWVSDVTTARQVVGSTEGITVEIGLFVAGESASVAGMGVLVELARGSEDKDGADISVG